MRWGLDGTGNGASTFAEKLGSQSGQKVDFASGLKSILFPLNKLNQFGVLVCKK